MDKLINDYIDKEMPECMNILMKYKQNKQRIRFIMKLNKKCNVVPNKGVVEEKNPEQSKKFRDEGNKIYSRSTTEDKLKEVCENYNKSIAYAPNQSTELSIAYANRSAVLFRLKKYQECVQCIDNCLSLEYPNNLKIKVLLRKMECLTILKDPRAKKHYHYVRKWIEKYSTNLEEKEEMRKKLDDCYKKEVESIQKNVENDLMKVFKDFHYKTVNKEVPSSSDALTIKYNDKFGRHIVAAKDIQPGEILAKETQYCLILKFNKRYLYCWKCLKMAWNCIPCEHCVNVIYCSEKCKEEAWSNFHKIECKILFRESESDVLYNNFIQALRMLLLGLNELGSITNLIAELKEVNKCTDPRMKGFSNDGKYYSNKYRTIYSLSTWSDKMDDVTFLLMPLFYTTFILYNLATKTTLFGRKFNGWEDMCENNEINIIGTLIFQHFEIGVTNTFTAIELLDNTDIWNDNNRGLAIFSFFSLLNHSCKPNVAKTHQKDYNFLYAIYPIKTGEQVYINYISNCNNISKLKRQQKLFQVYRFTCECVACRENWPVLSNYPKIRELAQIDTTIQLSLTSPYMVTPITEQLKSVRDVPIILHRLRDALDTILNIIGLYSPCMEIEEIIRKIMLLFEKSRYI